jgi:hypothetical protein
MIAEFYRLDATNTDVLASPSRLASIPYSGNLILEMIAQQSDGTNQFNVTVQLPNGDVPLDSFLLPDSGVDGAFNANDKYTVAFPVSQGGHVTINCTESGTAVMFIRCTLMP